MNRFITGLLLLGILLPPLPGFSDTSDPLVVGIKEAPPFSIRNENGSWKGVSVELWEDIAKSMGISFSYQEYGLQELLKAGREKKIDIAVGALTVNAQREKHLDFSHAFYDSGLGVAILGEPESGWKSLLTNIFSLRFLQAIAALLLVLGFAGFLCWIFERKRNPDQFGGGTIKGIANGLWWSAVTMTTVGYGDKAPVTTGGRVVALLWMYASVIIISSFTAMIASSLTVNELHNKIQSIDDLRDVRIATVEGSASNTFLMDRHIQRIELVSSVKEGLDLLASGEVKAMVYDAPILKFQINQEDFGTALQLLPQTYLSQPYAFAFPEGSTLVETVNRHMLNIMASPRWQRIKNKYIGTSD